MSEKKKIRCHFTLDVDRYPAHRYALDTLVEWMRKEKAATPNQGLLDGSIDLFHRNVYLAGLYLYELSPALAESLGTRLQHGGINPQALAAQLQQHQLAVREHPEASLGPGQLETVIQLLERQTEQLASQAQQVPAINEALSAQFQRLESRFDTLPTGETVEPAAFDQLRRQLTEHSEQLAAHAPSVAAPDEQVSTQLAMLASRIEALPSAGSDPAALSEIKQLLNQQQRVLNHLQKQLASPGIVPVAQPDEPDVPLEQTMQKVANVKAKGLW